MTDVYTGPERRRAKTIRMEAIEAVVERIIIQQIAAHEERERTLWNQAFPHGDPESHREYHQAKIDAAEAEKEFYQTLKIKLAEAGALGALKLVLWLLMMGLGAVIAGKFGVLSTFLGVPK